MKCPYCGKPVCAVDYPIEEMGVYYHVEDTEWVVYPDGDDPGVIGAKSGKLPIEVIHFEYEPSYMEHEDEDFF